MDGSAFPFLRATGALISGILVKEVVDQLHVSALECMLYAVVIFIIYLFFVLAFRKYRVGPIVALVSIMAFAMLGFLSAVTWESMHRPGDSMPDLESVRAYTVTIRSNASPTEKTIRYEAELDHVKMGERWFDTDERAIVYLIGDSVDTYRFGDRLLVRGSPEYVPQNSNPHAFNYGKYLQRRGIYLQDFVQKQRYIYIGKSNDFSIRSLSAIAGDHLESLLRQAIKDPREFHVVKAMVLGRREELTSEMEFVYQSTGTSHILAVSGLHVGIIYFIFSYIFQFLKDRNSPVYHGILLCAIWSFAFITGMSPSVQRAAIMFSIFIFAQLSSRRSNIYNSILVSAFIMLLFSPNLLFSVSFQLSYLAVIGIVYLYDKIYYRLYFKLAIADFFWKITSVSIAVQLATFPVTVYYFKQFPTVFLLTNLAAIPTAMLVLGSSMILFTFSFIKIIPAIAGKFVGGWVYGYNELLLKISQYAFTTIDDLYLRAYAVFFLLAITYLIIRVLESRDALAFRMLTFTLVVFAAVRIYDNYYFTNQKKLIFYDVDRRFYIDIFNGTYCYSNAIDDGTDATGIRYNINPNRKYHLVRRVEHIDHCRMTKKIGENLLINLGGSTVLILRNPGMLRENFLDITFDYLVVNRQSLRNIEDGLQALSIKNLILDNSVTEGHFRKISDGASYEYQIYSIRKDGAYIIDI